MKKLLSRTFGLILLCMMMVSIMIPAYAAGVIDTEKDVQFTIAYEKNGTVISGAKFDIYKVADIDAYAQMRLTDRFSDYPIEFDGLDQSDWDVLATTLKGYVWKDSLTADASGETDAEGNMQVTLKPGLYLVVGYRKTIDDTTYSAAPFLISLPSENADQNAWDYAVTAQPKADGETNPSDEPDDKLISRKVLKIWDDAKNENSRPKEITVHLMCDGKVYDTVTLNANNNWRFTWDNLERNHEWLITEDTVTGYTQTITQEGITFTVKNTVTPETSPSPTPPTPPSLPQTGLLWWPVLLLAVAGLLCIVIGLLRRKNAKSE